MALFGPHTGPNLNLLQDNRNFLLLIFSISYLFGTRRENFKVVFPSRCSAY